MRHLFCKSIFRLSLGVGGVSLVVSVSLGVSLEVSVSLGVSLVGGVL